MKIKSLAFSLFVLLVFSSVFLAGCASQTKISQSEIVISDQASEEPLGSEEAEIATGINEMDELDQLSTDQAKIEDLDNLGIE